MKIGHRSTMSPLAQRLAVAMAVQGYSQTELADCIGVSQMAVNNWVSRRHAPNILVLDKICRELEISIDWLLAPEKLHMADIGGIRR
jgi:transcriptional regulator with XRE-family HTH domain